MPNEYFLQVKRETYYPSEGVKIELELEKVASGEDFLDTSVKISGGFYISAFQRHELIERLGALLDEYRI